VPRRVGGRLRPLTVPPGPRRVSGPASRKALPQSTPWRVGETSLALDVLAALESLSQHRLLDRLIRGRTWIALVAFALIGIVTMQLGLLRLNGGIGRAIEREALLQRENAALSIENSEMASGDAVQLRATRLGMEFVAPGMLRFLAVSPRFDITRGAAALRNPMQPLPTAAEAGGGSAALAPSSESPTAGEPSGGSPTPSTSVPSSTESAGAPSEGSARTRSEGSAGTSSEGSAGTSSGGSSRSGESSSASGTAAPSEGTPASGGSANAPAAGGTESGSGG
jgi:hypothetical protein